VWRWLSPVMYPCFYSRSGRGMRKCSEVYDSTAEMDRFSYEDCLGSEDSLQTFLVKWLYCPPKEASIFRPPGTGPVPWVSKSFSKSVA
jgi:hypothetical protein